MESRMAQLSSSELQEKLNAALDERRQLLKEIEDLSEKLAAKEDRLMELQGCGLNKGLTGFIATLEHELERVKGLEADSILPSPVLTGYMSKASCDYVIEKITEKTILIRRRGRETGIRIRKAAPNYPIDVAATERVFQEFQSKKQG